MLFFGGEGLRLSLLESGSLEIGSAKEKEVLGLRFFLGWSFFQRKKESKTVQESAMSVIST